MPDEADWIDELYREEPREQPPAELDAAIRAAARRAATPWYRNARRLTALATAASVVIAALVIYQSPQIIEPLLDRTAAPGSAKPSVPATDDALRRQPAELKERADAQIAPTLETATEATDEPAPEPTAGPAPASVPVPKLAPTAEVKGEAAPRVSSDFAAPADDSLEAAPPAKAAATAVDADADAAVDEESFALPAEQEQRPDAVQAELEQAPPQRQALDRTAPVEPPTDCGELPGDPGSRRYVADVVGGFLITEADSGLRYWRCLDGEWIPVDPPSVIVEGLDQQQPEP